VRRIHCTLSVVFLFVSAVTVLAQETGAVSPVPIPVATRSQVYCTGFIANAPVPRDLYVVGGADDDFHSVVRQFAQGESIFISHQESGNLAVGAEYSVVRPANELFLTMHYQQERSNIARLGKPYEDVAQVRVTQVNQEGAVATVTFSCGPIVPGDLLMPFQPRDIPEYTVSSPLDPFVPLDKNKHQGRIVASHNNIGYFGQDTIVYLNLGENDGAKPGQRFRIYKLIPPHMRIFMLSQPTPPETLGEAVILSVQGKSSVAMVVSSYREISAGDFVEAE
jgi:hypothetical protein